MALDNVFTAPVPVPDVKLLLFTVLLAAEIALLNVLVVNCNKAFGLLCRVGSRNKSWKGSDGHQGTSRGRSVSVE